MSVPKDYKFSESHEWVREEGDNIVTIGITDYAQDKLGDIVAVELRRVGDEVERGESVGNIDSQKSSSEIMSPVAGVIIEINEDVEDDAGLVNSGPYEEGWLLRIEIEDASQLEDSMSAEDYEEYIGTLEDE